MNTKLQRNYKAIILDVDGTLITNEYGARVSRKVKEAILRSESKIKVGIASGRPLDRVTFIFDDLRLRTPCVIGGGTQVVDPVSKEILWEQPIDRKDLTFIRRAFRQAPYKVWVVDDTKEHLFESDIRLKKPLSFFLSKILETEADRLIKLFSPVPSLALTKVVAYHQGYVSLHITHVNATKQHAIQKVARLLNVHSDHIIGMGDGYNDFSLFKACGFRVAIGNAVPELKLRADYIAPSVHEDGVAHVFEKFVAIN